MDKAFESDGCSVVAEFDQRECCVRHDWLYWQGGSLAERRRADDEFYECIRESRTAWVAPFRWFGVRIGGVGFLPFGKFRWGFGWNWPRYTAPQNDGSPFTVESEREKFEELLEEARRRDQAWRDAHPRARD